MLRTFIRMGVKQEMVYALARSKRKRPAIPY